jgi:hypothetical protein
MPKVEIDYSNTIIYKITCKDPSITDVYVGHTTNFVQRKHSHKQSCKNDKSSNHNCKLYKVIRDKGGWQNWTMEIVNFFNCQDHYEARKKEQEYFTLLNATLNSIEPMPKPKEVIKCSPKPTLTYDVCNNIFGNEKIYEEHLQTTTKFICEKCDYKCCKKFCWEQHLSTGKHKNATQSYIDVIDNYECECGKKYKHHPSFYRHKKNCKGSPQLKDDQIDINSLDMSLIMQLLKQNDEFKSLMVEQNNKMMESFQELCKNIAKEVTIDKTTT